MEAPVFDESTLDDEERQLLAMLRQVVAETIRPLFEERWPDFEAMLVPVIERHLLEATREQDDQLPKLLADLVVDAVKPLQARLQKIEAMLFRHGLR